MFEAEGGVFEEHPNPLLHLHEELDANFVIPDVPLGVAEPEMIVVPENEDVAEPEINVGQENEEVLEVVVEPDFDHDVPDADLELRPKLLHKLMKKTKERR